MVSPRVWTAAAALVLLTALPSAPCAAIDETTDAAGIGNFFRSEVKYLTKLGAADGGVGNVQTLSPQCSRVDTKPNGQRVCVKVVRDTSWECVGSIAGCAAAGMVILALSLPCILIAFGFGVLGVIFGSIAAVFQGGFGTPCCFKVMQSVGMRSTSAGTRFFFGLVGAAVGAVAGAFSLPNCFAEREFRLN